MIKIVIEETLGEVKKVITLETDNIQLARDLLELSETQVVVDVKQDVPNLMIEDNWKHIIEELQKKADKYTSKPYKSPDIYPWTDDKFFEPYKVTC